MARFVIRNYGTSKQVPYKGQQITFIHDQAIETDDEILAGALAAQDRAHLTDRGLDAVALVPPEVPDEKKERKVTVDKEPVPKEDAEDIQKKESETDAASEEIDDGIAYEEMTVKELQVLAKDRQLSTSGLLKDELIQALKDYDSEE